MGIIRFRHCKEYPSINLGYMAHTCRAILKDKRLVTYGRVCQKRKEEAILLVISDAPTDYLAIICQDLCQFVVVQTDD